MSSDNEPPVLNYADNDVGRYVTVARFRDESEAHMAASFLNGEGIEALVVDRVLIAGRRRPAVLRVLADDREAAISKLMSTPARPYIIRAQ